MVQQKGENMCTPGIHCNREEKEGKHDGHGERKGNSAKRRKIMHPCDAFQQKGDKERTHPWDAL